VGKNLKTREKVMSSLTLSSAEIPTWLNANFIRDLLQISQTFHFTIEHACKKGENFASKIFRVTIFLDESHASRTIILKSRPFNENTFSEEFLKKFNIFPKEIESYALIERFEEILSEAGIKTSFGSK
jgi:hypothetical protein